MSYTLYVDESGETGISRVRTDSSPGASPYMTLGAVLIDDESKQTLVNLLDEVAEKFGRSALHSNRLNHRQKVYYSKKLSEQDIVCFGLISLKATLGEYRSRISEDNTMYFNKCAMYLLECVGEFMQVHGITSDELTIIFEEGHHNYGQFRSLIGTCQDNPIHPRARLLQHIDLRNIVDASKTDEPLLQMADLVAHILYQTVNKSDSNYQITELRYLTELHKRFFCDLETNRICPKGLKPIHTIRQIGLDNNSLQTISQFEGEMLLPR